MGTGSTVGTVGGAALGTAILPGVGTVLGAGLGGAIGGMFDPKAGAQPAPQYTFSNPYSRQDQQATNTAMNFGNTMYGRTSTGFQDEANRTLAAANQRAAAYGQTGTDQIARMKQLGGAAQGQAFEGQANAADMQGRSNAYQGNAIGNAAGYAGLGASDRAQTQSSIAALRNFANNGPGPSAAQAQLQAGSDANMAQAIALAHSGRGAGQDAQAMRQAQFGNAAAGQQLNQQSALLRANETAAFNQQRLNALGMAQQGNQGLINSDLTGSGQQLGFAGQMGQQGLGYGQLGATYQGMGNQAQLGFEGLGANTGLGYANLQNTAAQQGEQNRANVYQSQQQADVSRYGADKGAAVGMAGVNQRQDAANQAFLGSMIAGGVNMMGSGGGGGGPNPYGGQSQAQFYGAGYGNPDAGGIINPYT